MIYFYLIEYYILYFDSEETCSIEFLTSKSLSKVLANITSKIRQKFVFSTSMLRIIGYHVLHNLSFQDTIKRDADVGPGTL